jgi:peptidyl-prolyl cis-trans isomerase SurA
MPYRPLAARPQEMIWTLMQQNEIYSKARLYIMHRINTLRILFLFFCCIMLLPFQSHCAELVDKIVAVVNEDVITQSELKESMLPFIADYRVRYGEENLEGKMDEARQDALNRLIEERLILQESKKRKVVVEDFEIQERIDEVKQRFRDESEFLEAINASGITLYRLKQKYEEQIMMRKLINALINSRVNISPTQIAAYYYGNIKDFTMPNMARFKVFFSRFSSEESPETARRLAADVSAKIRQGEDFDMLVRQFSQGPNVDRGGDMGYMPEGSTIPELEDEIARLNPGEISDIISTDSGLYIIMVLDKKLAGPVPISEVNDVIKERLFQRESELTLREFVAKLKEDAYITFN